MNLLLKKVSTPTYGFFSGRHILKENKLKKKKMKWEMGKIVLFDSFSSVVKNKDLIRTNPIIIIFIIVICVLVVNDEEKSYLRGIIRMMKSLPVL